MFNNHYWDVYCTSIAGYDFTPEGLSRLTFIGAIIKLRKHESINLIRNKISFTNEYTFQVISPESFVKYTNKLQNNKAGHDYLKVTLIRLSGTQLCNSLCAIFNMCITTPSFPSQMR